MMHAAQFAAMFAALYTAHQLADHWIQTDRQAAQKAAPGWPGRLACTAHVATYTLTAFIVVCGTAEVLSMHLSLPHVAVGLAASGLTHWVIDRRWPLFWLADRTGSRRFVRLGAPRHGHGDNPCLGTGAYALDQSAHHLFLLIAALIIAA